MPATRDTIYALASGSLPAAVAVIRISGPAAGSVLSGLSGRRPDPRRTTLVRLRIPSTGTLIDTALVVWMPAPASFTGENVVELHVHGSRAVVSLLLDSLAEHPGTRAAEPGEFTRRAFLNGKLDLSEVEGLADLLAAETEVQRRQAIRLAEGALTRRTEDWRARLLTLRARIEALLDFSDEDSVSEMDRDLTRDISAIHEEIAAFLQTGRAAERVRDGFRVALMGRPNAGKSTLLNAIARRNVAIVTSEPGTTRDVLEVPLDLAGYPVLLFDTAGLRDATSQAEQEGVRRAYKAGEAADLVLWLREPGDNSQPPALGTAQVRLVWTKADLGHCALLGPGERSVSAETGFGMSELLASIESEARDAMGYDGGLVARRRHKEALGAAAANLLEAARPDLPVEIMADLLRSAADAIGRISGRVDIEDVLDSLFSEFCIGK